MLYTPKDLSAYPSTVDILEGEDPCALDTETAGATRESNLIIYFSYAARDVAPEGGAGSPLTTKGLECLKSWCESERPIIFHNAKFDIPVISQVGAVPQGEIHDTTLMHTLLDERHLGMHRLKVLSRELLGRSREDEIELHRAQKQYGKATANLHVPQELLHKYAVADAVDTLDLYYLLRPELEKQGLWDLYREECNAQYWYISVEAAGIGVNVDYLDEAYNRVEKALNALTEKLFEAFKCRFNPNSPKQVSEVLSRFFALTEKTASGYYSTDKAVLEKYLVDPKMQLYFGYKFLSRALSTLKGYKERLSENGRLHPSFRLTTATGRTACSNPNLQTIPKQRGRITEVEVGSEELAAECREAFRSVRKVFVAPPGALLLSIDYSQIEYRCAVHYSGSKKLVDALLAGEDFHTLICRMVFNDVNPRLRHLVKMLNYGMLYGMGPRTMIRQLGRDITKGDPRDIYDQYIENTPDLQSFKKRVEATVKRRGYVRDIAGRRYRHIPGKEYIAVAYLCQGTAAYFKKQSLCRIQPLIQERRSKTILDIHDEWVWEIYPEDVDLIPFFINCMQDFPQLSVPVIVECSIGSNLLDQKEVSAEEAQEQLRCVSSS